MRYEQAVNHFLDMTPDQEATAFLGFGPSASLAHRLWTWLWWNSIRRSPAASSAPPRGDCPLCYFLPMLDAWLSPNDSCSTPSAGRRLSTRRSWQASWASLTPTVHRALVDLRTEGIVGRVSHGTAHLPSSQRYHLTANGVRETAWVLGFATPSDFVRLPHVQGVADAAHPQDGRGGQRLPPRRLTLPRHRRPPVPCGAPLTYVVVQRKCPPNWSAKMSI